MVSAILVLSVSERVLPPHRVYKARGRSWQCGRVKWDRLLSDTGAPLTQCWHFSRWSHWKSLINLGPPPALFRTTAAVVEGSIHELPSHTQIFFMLSYA